MREHGLAVYIACRPYAGDICLAVFVGDNGTALCLNAYRLKSDIGCICASADGNENFIRRNLALLAAQLVCNLAGGNSRNLGAEQKFHALCLIIAEENLRDFAVGGSRYMVEHFDNGDFCADGIEIRSHLKPDYTAAYDCEGSGCFFHIEYLAVCHGKAGCHGFAKPGYRRNESI